MTNPTLEQYREQLKVLIIQLGLATKTSDADNIRSQILNVQRQIEITNSNYYT